MKTIIFDVEGTIIKEGKDSPKLAGLKILKNLIRDSTDFGIGLINGKHESAPRYDFARENYILELSPPTGRYDPSLVGSTSVIGAPVPQNFTREKIDSLFQERIKSLAKNPEYFQRFYNSVEQIDLENPDSFLPIYFEALKEQNPKLAKHLDTIMIAGLTTGEIPLHFYENAVEVIENLHDFPHNIGTYSGASEHLQKIMFSKIPTDNGSNLGALINQEFIGTKKKFGNKTDWKSYVNLANYCQEKNVPLLTFISDSLAEAEACANAAEQTKENFYPLFVNRKGIKEPKEIRTMNELNTNVLTYINVSSLWG